MSVGNPTKWKIDKTTVTTWFWSPPSLALALRENFVTSSCISAISSRHVRYALCSSCISAKSSPPSLVLMLPEKAWNHHKGYCIKALSLLCQLLVFLKKPVLQSCAVPKNEKFWRATGQSNLAYKRLVATKASKVWFSYSHNCTLANGAVFHCIYQVWLSSGPSEIFTFSNYYACLWYWLIKLLNRRLGDVTLVWFDIQNTKLRDHYILNWKLQLRQLQSY